MQRVRGRGLFECDGRDRAALVKLEASRPGEVGDDPFECELRVGAAPSTVRGSSVNDALEISSASVDELFLAAREVEVERALGAPLSSTIWLRPVDA